MLGRRAFCDPRADPPDMGGACLSPAAALASEAACDGVDAGFPKLKLSGAAPAEAASDAGTIAPALAVSAGLPGPVLVPKLELAGAASAWLVGFPKVMAGFDAPAAVAAVAELASAVLAALPALDSGAGLVAAGAVPKVKVVGAAADAAPDAPAVVAGGDSCSLAPSAGPAAAGAAVTAAPVAVEPRPPDAAVAAVLAGGAADAAGALRGKLNCGALLGAVEGAGVATAVGRPAKLGTLGGPAKPACLARSWGGMSSSSSLGFHAL